MTTKNTGKHTGRTIKWRERNTTIEVAQILGTGGEGEVYAVKQHPDLAIKIYHENRRPKGQMAEKLSAMEINQPDFSKNTPTRLPRVAWPTKVIKDSGGEQVTGIVMPMVDRAKTDPMSHVLNPTTRKLSLPKHRITEQQFKQKRWAIAQNIMAAVRGIHRVRCVIGDVNDENILVDPATGEISIVDCDAFQVTDTQNKKIHRCRVGREQFTAPELLTQLAQDDCKSKTCANGKEMGHHKPDYSCLNRQPEHDMFGIGVILFKLFMNGAHPYNQRSDASSKGQSTLKNLISSRQYPYDSKGPSHRVTQVNQSLYSELPDSLKTLFLKTFV